VFCQILLSHRARYHLTIFPRQYLIQLDPVQACGQCGGNHHIHVSSGIGLPNLPVSRVYLADGDIAVLVAPADPMPCGLFDRVVAADVAVDARHAEGAEQWIIVQDSGHELLFVDGRVDGDMCVRALRGGAVFSPWVVGRKGARGHGDVQAALVPNGLDDVLGVDEIVDGEQGLAMRQGDFESAWMGLDQRHERAP
jgi:hypothetical protein